MISKAYYPNAIHQMPRKLESDTIGMLLTDVSRLLRGAFDRKVNAMDLGITPGEARTLVQVAVTEGIKQAEIATRMGIEPMTLSAYPSSAGRTSGSSSSMTRASG